MYRYTIDHNGETECYANLWEAAFAARDMVRHKNADLTGSGIYMTFFENEGSAYTFECADGSEATLTRTVMGMAEGYGNDATINGSEAAASLLAQAVNPMEGDTYGVRLMSCYASWNIVELVNNHTCSMVMRYAPDMPAIVVDTKGGSQAGLQETLDCINTGLRIFAERRYPMLGKFPELYAAGDSEKLITGFVCGQNFKMGNKHSRLLILPELGKFMLD